VDKLRWCLKKEKGVKLVRPNDNVCRSYVKKAESSLVSMRLNSSEGIDDWTASTAYYEDITCFMPC
jgi:hypothetical protein